MYDDEKIKTHSDQYNIEKEKRWKMAEIGEEKAIKKIADIICLIIGIPKNKATYGRLDEIWFNIYSPEKNIEEWVKGCPDYFIKIFLDSDNEKYLYIEIKLKSVGFRKTLRGGRTKTGSNIPDYGCVSYYIDKVPVLSNMNLFCKKTGLDKKKSELCT